MLQRPAGGRFLEVFLFTLSSLVLYHIGIGIGAFLIPLQVVASRRGEGSLLFSCGGFLLVFLALRFLPFLGGALQPDILTVVEIAFVTFLLLGLLAVNFPLTSRDGSRGRTLYRLLGSTAVVGLAAIPLGIWLSRSTQFQEAMGVMFSEVSRALTSLFAGREGTADPALSALLSPAALRRISDAYVTRSLLAMYFLLLSFSWWAGQASVSRGVLGAQRRFHFADFRLESAWLWPLMAACVLVLADLFFTMRGSGRTLTAAPQASASAGVVTWLAYGGWNVGLVLLILHGLQGLAILRFLFEKHRLPRLLWLLLLIGLLALAASPRAGLFVMLGLPAFGISENWIRYRVVQRREPNESE
jgi:hypothetical protein